MKTFSLIPFLIVIGLSGCDRGSNKSTLSSSITLRLDDAHNQAAGSNAAPYLIAPCQNLNLIAEGYKIPIPTQIQASGPNSIHLIHGNEEYFRTEWDGKTSIVLSVENLKNIRGSMSFSGFKSGETYILGVGRDNFPEPKLDFNVMWAGTVKVSPTAK